MWFLCCFIVSQSQKSPHDCFEKVFDLVFSPLSEGQEILPTVSKFSGHAGLYASRSPASGI
jgi:hypothetical protein